MQNQTLTPPPNGLDLRGTKLVCLMANFNKKATIQKAIESVLMQETDFPFKLIVMDDCSTDGSFEIAKKLESQNPEKIIVTRAAQNEGLLARTLEGYAHLKGVEYFCVLDSDDWYIYPKKFSDAVHFLEAHPAHTGYFADCVHLKPNEPQDWDYLLRFPVEKPPTLDFNWEDFKNGKGLFRQTSCSVFRNIYFQNSVPQKLLDFAKRPDGRVCEADGLRVPWHAAAGRTHFINRKESVYNADGNGLWSQFDDLKQKYLNTQANFSFAEFFGENDAPYFFKEARRWFVQFLNLLQKNPEQIPQYEDFLLQTFKKIYLENPYFNALERQEPYPETLVAFFLWGLKHTQLKMRGVLKIRTRLKKLLGMA